MQLRSIFGARILVVGVVLLALLGVGCFYAWFDLTDHIVQVGDIETELNGNVFTVKATYQLVDDGNIPADFPGFKKIGFWIETLEGPGCPCYVKNAWLPFGGVGSVVYADLSNAGGLVMPGDTFEVKAEVLLDSIKPFTILATPCGAVHLKGEVVGDCPVQEDEH